MHHRAMRKWYVPLTLAGLTGLGLFCLTERGRRALRSALARVHLIPEAFEDWAAATEREVHRLQHAVDRVAKSLDAAR